MLLLVGDPEDLTLAYLGWLARERDIPVTILDEVRFGLDWWIEYDDGIAGGFLRAADSRIGFAEIEGAIVRFNPTAGIADDIPIDEGDAALYSMERRHCISYWLDQALFTVVNRPVAGRANASKPLQMSQLAAAGFLVPEWIATNDVRRSTDMAERWGECVVKSLSGMRSRVRIIDDHLLEVLPVSTPVIVQRRIHGSDVRVHVVGETSFAAEVTAETVDYRWDDADKSYCEIVVPFEIERRCVETARRIGLDIAGFDFRLDARGQWWCLEVNPVPTFLPYEAGTNAPIGDAVITAASGRSCGSNERSPLGRFAA